MSLSRLLPSMWALPIAKHAMVLAACRWTAETTPSPPSLRWKEQRGGDVALDEVCLADFFHGSQFTKHDGTRLNVVIQDN